MQQLCTSEYICTQFTCTIVESYTPGRPVDTSSSINGGVCIWAVSFAAHYWNANHHHGIPKNLVCSCYITHLDVLDSRRRWGTLSVRDPRGANVDVKTLHSLDGKGEAYRTCHLKSTLCWLHTENEEKGQLRAENRLCYVYYATTAQIHVQTSKVINMDQVMGIWGSTSVRTLVMDHYKVAYFLGRISNSQTQYMERWLARDGNAGSVHGHLEIFRWLLIILMWWLP